MIFDIAAYRAEVHRRMADTTGWTILGSITAGAAILVLRALMGTLTLIDVMAATLTTVIGYAFARSLFHRKRLAACFALHQDYEAKAAARDKQSREQIAGLEAQVRKLTSEQTDKRNFKLIADRLTALHAEGIVLLGEFPTSSDNYQYNAWKDSDKQFRARVAAEMEALGCSLQEIHGFVHVGEVPTALSLQLRKERRVNGLIARLDHLGTVATSYANRAALAAAFAKD